jgi:hypothetical protein
MIDHTEAFACIFACPVHSSESHDFFWCRHFLPMIVRYACSSCQPTGNPLPPKLFSPFCTPSSHFTIHN